MEAIVLAGGLGTRLRPVVSDMPKPLATVAGRPFLAWQLDMLAAQGVTRVVLATGYQAGLISSTLGTRWAAMKLEYRVESEPQGTGGALRDALELISDARALVLNGDTYLSIDFAAMLRVHQARGSRVTVAVSEVADAARYGTVEVLDGYITRFIASGNAGAGLINAGVYLADRYLLSDAPSGSFSFERDFLQPRVAALRPAAFVTKGLFIDIGTPEDYALAQTIFRRRSS